MKTGRYIQTKVRCGARLQTLPEHLQDEIHEYRKTHTPAKTVAWLAGQGIKTSSISISDWESFYQLKMALAKHQDRILARMENFKKRHPSLTTEAIEEMGEYCFNSLAIDQEDFRGWTQAQQTRRNRQKLLLAKKVAEETGGDGSPLTFEEKEARMKQILGIQ